MLRGSLWLAVATLLAGCLAPAADLAPSSADLAAQAKLLAHQAAGLVPVPVGYEDVAAIVSPTGYRRGEPTVGVTSDGTIFAAAGDPVIPEELHASREVPFANVGPTAILRSRDHGASWEALRNPVFDPVLDFDPWVWVDPATDRVFHAPLYVACSWVAWSDDAGDSWDATPAGGCGVPAHDHQKLTTGPAPDGVATEWEGGIVYYAYNSFRGEGTVASVSLDGGRTWSLGVTAHPADPCMGGINGPVVVAADGTAYLPKPTCDGVAVAVSKDGGATWEQATPITEGGGPTAGRLVTLHAAVDEGGNVHVAWTDANELLRLATSTDGGATWTTRVVSAPHIKSVVFSDVVAGAAGHAAVAYVGTTTDPTTWPEMDPSVATNETVWHFYLAYLDDALAADPVVVTLQVTPEDDPAQIGCIWLHGGTQACRNMRDFIGAYQRDGRVYAVYADGCDKCATAEDSRRLGETTVIIVERGPSLLGGLLGALPEVAVDSGREPGPAGLLGWLRGLVR